MATYDYTRVGATNATGNRSWDSKQSVFVLSNVIDLTASTSLTSGDIYQCLTIPADTLVTNVWIEMVTPATGTALTANVGDGNSATGWDAAMSLKGTAGTFTSALVGTDAYVADDSATAQGTFYTAVDTIDVALATVTAITAGPKFRIFAHCICLNQFDGF